MDINSAFPSRYLKAGDDVPDEGQLVLTIRDVTLETVGQGKDAQDKPIVYFRESDKGLVCNKTNAKTLAKLLGDDTDDWAGRRIALFVTEVQFPADMVPAIRVKTKLPAAKPATAPVSAEAEDDDDPSIPF